MKRIVFLFALALVAMLVQAQKVNVAAAANLRYVLEEIKTAYLKQHPQSVVNITYGSSGTLVQQILNGATYDFFMSADQEYPVKLKEKGLTVGPISTYACGKLVLYSTMLDVEHKGLEVLNDPVVQKVAIANPETATYGNRTVELLKNKGFYELVKSKMVVGDNISQAAQFVYTGNAEVGFVALSLALAPEMANKGNYYVVPPKGYTPIEQACVLIKTPVLNTESVRFRRYILSVEVFPVWEKYGYAVPEKPLTKK